MNITITLFCSPHCPSSYAQCGRRPPKQMCRIQKGLHAELPGLGQTVEKVKQKNDTVFKEPRNTFFFLNEGDPHLYGSYIQKPVA